MIKKGNKTKNQLVISALYKGKPLNLTEITNFVIKTSGEKIKIPDLSNVIWVLSNPKKCSLGYFIKKNKEGKLYEYSFVEEALKLSEDKLFALTIKRSNYTLEDALNEYPDLRKYVKAEKNENQKKNGIKVEESDLTIQKATANTSSDVSVPEAIHAESEKTALSIIEGILKMIFNKSININVKVTFQVEK